MMRSLFFILMVFFSCRNEPKQNVIEIKVPDLVVDSDNTVKVLQEEVKVIDYDTTQWKEITEKEHGIILDIKYASPVNFTGVKIYDCARCFLRPILAKKLIQLQREIQKDKKWSIKVFDCYRPVSAQQKLWDQVPNAAYVTPPHKGSMHNRGMAVDLTLVDENGKELNMGSTFDSFSKKSHVDYLGHSEEVINNRTILIDLMNKEQLKGIRTEWWHYSLRSSYSEVSDWTWSCDN